MSNSAVVNTPKETIKLKRVSKILSQTSFRNKLEIGKSK
jgi:hypothetical protein